MTEDWEVFPANSTLIVDKAIKGFYGDEAALASSS